MGRAARARRGLVEPSGHRGPSRVPVIGVDIGGVLVDRVAEDSDTSFFGDRPLDTPAVPGAFAGLVQLAEMVEYRIHIVSKAGPKVAELSRQWLGRHGVLDGTSIPASNLHFVRKRADKHEVCERLQVTHFIDDRVDVLAHLLTVPHRYLFVGGLGHHPVPDDVPPDMRVVPAWPALVTAIAQSIGREPASDGEASGT